MISLVSPTKGTRTHSSVTATTDAGLLVAASAHRKTVLIQNQGSVTVYLGKSTVTTSGSTRGYALFAGSTFVDNASTEAWYVIAASSTAIIHVLEVA